jgi:2-polyprenyl-3-methyl-5-hydroxy-6-metoxy-1,4-benzoquinol methylase
MTFLENDIRPQRLMKDQAICFENDVKRLLRHENDFVFVGCPSCQGSDFAESFKKYGINFVTCQGCETIYANPRPRPEHILEYYRDSENYAYWNKYIFPASEHVRREKIFKPRVQRVLEVCQKLGLKTDILLEVGTGFGIFCEEMKKERVFKRIVGVEPTPELAATCRLKGVEIVEKPIEEVEHSDFLSPGEEVDVIVNFELIEHLFSPRDFLLKCRNLLSPKGILILTCPNGKGFDVTVMREVSPALDAEHINLFNPNSLAMLMEDCGFKVLEKRTPGQLDVDLVRNKVLAGEFDLSSQPFLKRIVMDEYETTGQAFQKFLQENQLSSNMMIIAQNQPG